MKLRFAQSLEVLIQKLSKQPLTIGEIWRETSERRFCLRIGLLVFAFLFLMPARFSCILGLSCLVRTIQMAMGENSLRLPIANNSYVWRDNGLCMSWLAFSLMLAILLTNPLAAIANVLWLWTNYY